MINPDPSQGAYDCARAVAWAPASLSNLGPGFDCLGLAISELGDTVTATHSDREGVTITYHEDSPWIGPSRATINTAGMAALHLLSKLDFKGGVNLEIRKGIIPGSGVGSSAASAVAAAWAVNLLFESPFEKPELITTVLEGEAVASGAAHGDNALPSLFGGMVVVSAGNPEEYRRIDLTESPVISLVLPRMEILTKEARSILPESVPLETAAVNASHLAMLVSAIQAGDWEQAGYYMMQDRIVEPVRVRMLPGFESVRNSAVEAGAFGCSLSGSGPAIYAISDSASTATRVLDAMMVALRLNGHSADGIVTHVDQGGVRQVQSVVSA